MTKHLQQSQQLARAELSYLSGFESGQSGLANACQRTQLLLSEAFFFSQTGHFVAKINEIIQVLHLLYLL